MRVCSARGCSEWLPLRSWKGLPAERLIVQYIVAENSGTGAGWRSESGVKSLNFWKSATLLGVPGMWAAQRMNGRWAESKVSLHMNRMMVREREPPLFRISTTEVLSEWMRFSRPFMPMKNVGCDDGTQLFHGKLKKDVTQSEESQTLWSRMRRTISPHTSHQNLRRELLLWDVGCPGVE